ncbi:MAG: hypothetical protein NVSMB64_07220 [Candidatus Velthaea sp.]
MHGHVCAIFCVESVAVALKVPYGVAAVAVTVYVPICEAEKIACELPFATFRLPALACHRAGMGAGAE